MKQIWLFLTKTCYIGNPWPGLLSPSRSIVIIVLCSFHRLRIARSLKSVAKLPKSIAYT